MAVRIFLPVLSQLLSPRRDRRQIHYRDRRPQRMDANDERKQSDVDDCAVDDCAVDDCTIKTWMETRPSVILKAIQGRAEVLWDWRSFKGDLISLAKKCENVDILTAMEVRGVKICFEKEYQPLARTQEFAWFVLNRGGTFLDIVKLCFKALDWKDRVLLDKLLAANPQKVNLPVYRQDKNRFETILYHAYRRMGWQGIPWVLDGPAGELVDWGDSNHYFLLFIAIAQESYEMIDLLMKHGAFLAGVRLLIKSLKPKPVSPFQRVLLCNNPNLVYHVLSRSSLEICCELLHSALVHKVGCVIDTVLANNHPCLYASDGEGSGALHWVVFGARDSWMKEQANEINYFDRFLQADVDPWQKNHKGETPLDLAIHLGRWYCVWKYATLLLSRRGALPNSHYMIKSSEDEKELISTLHAHRRDLVKWLLTEDNEISPVHPGHAYHYFQDPGKYATEIREWEAKIALILDTMGDMFMDVLFHFFQSATRVRHCSHRDAVTAFLFKHRSSTMLLFLQNYFCPSGGPRKGSSWSLSPTQLMILFEYGVFPRFAPNSISLFEKCCESGMETGLVEFFVFASKCIPLIKERLDEPFFFRDMNCMNALHCAAKMGHIGLTMALLEKGATVDVKTPSGLRPNCTALWYAVCQGHHDIVKVLLDHGASIHVTASGHWHNLVEDAAESGHWSIVHTLICHGSSLPYHMGHFQATMWDETTGDFYPGAWTALDLYLKHGHNVWKSWSRQDPKHVSTKVRLFLTRHALFVFQEMLFLTLAQRARYQELRLLTKKKLVRTVVLKEVTLRLPFNLQRMVLNKAITAP